MQLSRKLAVLIALVTGYRLQTIGSICLPNIQQSAECFQIFIPDSIKSSGPGRLQPCLKIPFFKENKSICPAETLITYLQATLTLRHPREDALFILTVKPHTRATKQTIARWMKQILALSGVDISKFAPHSTRHASTSAVFRAGVSVDSIMKTAGWSQNSTVFARFYNRPVQEEGFAKTVLSQA